MHSSVRDYLDVLPDGLDSYPEFQVKGTMIRSFLDRVDLEALRPLVPERALASITRPLVTNDWVPEVHLCAVERAFYAALAGEREQWMRDSYAMNKRTLSSPVYAFALRTITARRALKVAPVMWQQLHRGSRMEVIETDDGILLMLTYPPHAYFRDKVDSVGTGFIVAAHAAGEANASLDVDSFAAERAVFRLRWNRAAG